MVEVDAFGGQDAYGSEVPFSVHHMLGCTMALCPVTLVTRVRCCLPDFSNVKVLFPTSGILN